MKFIIGGERGIQYLERLTYRGSIGIFYDTTFGGLAAYLIFAIVTILTVIGLYTVCKWLLGGRKKKK